MTCILDAVATLAPSIQDAVKDSVTAATHTFPVADAVKDSAAKDSVKEVAQAPLQDLKELKDLTDAPKLDGLQAQAAQQSTAGANADDFVLAAPVTRNMGKNKGKSHQKKKRAKHGAELTKPRHRQASHRASGLRVRRARMRRARASSCLR